MLLVHLAAFIALCWIWGSSWIGIKFSLMGFPALYGAGLRFAAAALLVGLYLRLRGRSFRLPGGGVRAWVVATGILTYPVDYGLIYWAEQYLSAGVTAVLFATFPLFTALTSVFVLRLERFRISLLAGLSLGFLGVVCIFRGDLAVDSLQGPMLAAGAGVLFGALCAAFSTGLVKKHLTQVDPVLLTFYQTLLGTAGLMAGGWLLGERLLWEQVTLLSAVSVVYLGAVASALAFSIYFWLLQRFPPTSMSVIIYVTPVVALLIDWVYSGEAPGWPVVWGVILISAGIAVAEFPKYRKWGDRRRMSDRDPAAKPVPGAAPTKS